MITTTIIIIIIIIIIVSIIIIHILTILINNYQMIFSLFRSQKYHSSNTLQKIHYSLTLPKLPLFQSYSLICQTNPLGSTTTTSSSLSPLVLFHKKEPK
jgi:hypothetical protein